MGSKAMPGWYAVLLAARGVAIGGVLMARALAKETKMPPNVASAWLAKFVRWGYARRSGSAKGPARWERVYVLTKYGQTRKAPLRTIRKERS